MNIRLIDVDSHNFPNLPLMKLSAYHKMKGDHVDWYDPLSAWKESPDLVYMSKVFSFAGLRLGWIKGPQEVIDLINYSGTKIHSFLK